MSFGLDIRDWPPASRKLPREASTLGAVPEGAQAWVEHDGGGWFTVYRHARCYVHCRRVLDDGGETEPIMLSPALRVSAVRAVAPRQRKEI